MSGRPLCLFVFANAAPGADGHLRHLSAERNGLRDALDRLRDTLGIESRVEVDPPPELVLSLLRDEAVRSRLVALHYSGHAEPDRWLMPDAGRHDALFADGFVPLLDGLPALRLVVLNGCSTARQAAALAGAQRAVIGTDAPIADDVAEIFAVRLYYGLARGVSVAEAFGGARDDVLALRSGAADRLWRMGRARGAPPPGQPWHLEPKTEAPDAWGWRLADAVADPLVGLPALPRGPLPESPYRHVERFTGDYAEVFFGRGQTIRRVFDALVDPDGPPALVVCGVAGVGKSSLLEAGVVPRLRALGRRVAHHRHDPATPLADGLRGCLSLDREAPLDWAAAEEAAGGPIVAVIDQVEEALIAAEGRQAVLDGLLEPVGRAFADPDGPRGRLVLSLRKSHLAEVREALRRNGLPFVIVFVEPLDRAAVIEIVRGPLSAARLRDHYRLTIEDGLAERIADDLTAGAPAAVAPILQIVLTGMWGDPAGRAVHFDGARYEAVRRSGVTLERVFARQLATAEARSGGDGLVLDVLGFHTTGRGTSNARRADELAQRYAGRPVEAALDACIDARLIGRWSADDDAGTRLAHDVWGPLVLDAERASERPGQRARRILEHRAGDWRAGEGDGLLDRYDLVRVEAGLDAMRAPTADEVALVEASRVAVAEAEARRRRRRVLALGAVVLITITAAVAGWLSWQLDGALEAETAATDKAEAALVAETEANRKTTEALGSARALGWLKMAGESADDPTLVAAALAEVPPDRRGPEWFQAALRALDAPLAADWIAADRLIGFTADDRLAIVRDGRIELHDLESGRLRRRDLPAGWAEAPLVIDDDGAVVALIRSAGEPHRVEIRRLPPKAAVGEGETGPSFDCELEHARAGSGRWLFGGVCRGARERPWLLGRDGARVELTARPPVDPVGADAPAARVTVVAVDPAGARMALCWHMPGEGGGTSTALGRAVPPADAPPEAPRGLPGACPTAAFGADGRLLSARSDGAGRLRIDDGRALEPRFAPGKAVGWSLASVGPARFVAAGTDGSLTQLPLDEASSPTALGSRLGRIAAPWAAWAAEPPPGSRFDARVAVGRGRLVDLHLGAARVWLANGLPPSAISPAAAEQRPVPADPPVRFVPVARRPFEHEPSPADPSDRPLVSADGQRSVVRAQGLVYLNQRPPAVEGEAPAWSVELPPRDPAVPVAERYAFLADGRWLRWGDDSGSSTVWPATIGAAGALLDIGRRGCTPPHFYSTYQGLSLADAEAAWAKCEAERRPVEDP